MDELKRKDVEELEPPDLLEEEALEPKHFVEQSGSESVHEGPLRQDLVVPTVTQQYPGLELLCPLREEEELKLHFA